MTEAKSKRDVALICLSGPKLDVASLQNFLIPGKAVGHYRDAFKDSSDSQASLTHLMESVFRIDFSEEPEDPYLILFTDWTDCWIGHVTKDNFEKIRVEFDDYISVTFVGDDVQFNPPKHP